MKEIPKTRWALTATLILLVLILVFGSTPLWIDPRSFENSWLLKLTDNLLWTPVSTVVLILTLLTVLVYTYQTYRIANLQGEEIGLHKHPVIAVQFNKGQWLRRKRSNKPEEDPKFEFLTVVYNLSNVHATAWLRASLWMKSTRKWELLYQCHERGQFYLYSGLRSWTLQAKSNFRGNLDLRTILKRLLESEQSLLEKQSWVKIEVEAIAHSVGTERKAHEFKPTEPAQFWEWTGTIWMPWPDFDPDIDCPA